jgi:hypothetical protein
MLRRGAFAAVISLQSGVYRKDYAMPRNLSCSDR